MGITINAIHINKNTIQNPNFMRRDSCMSCLSQKSLAAGRWWRSSRSQSSRSQRQHQRHETKSDKVFNSAGPLFAFHTPMKLEPDLNGDEGTPLTVPIKMEDEETHSIGIDADVNIDVNVHAAQKGSNTCVPETIECVDSTTDDCSISTMGRSIYDDAQPGDNPLPAVRHSNILFGSF